MNRNSYRIVFNERTGTMVAVAETALAKGKGHGAGGSTSAAASFSSAIGGGIRSFCIVVAAAVMGLAYNPMGIAQTVQLPTNGTVVTGTGRAVIGARVGDTMTITQSTQRVAINWDSFNVGSGGTVNFVQPNSSSVALNRVVGGGGGTVIAGNINANGHVFIVDPQGVMFTSTAVVDVGGLVASNLGISDANFMAGKYEFAAGADGEGAAAGGSSTGRVVNEGNIKARTTLNANGKAVKGGSIVLMGNGPVENRAGGVIEALRGSVVMASGGAITLAYDKRGLLTADVTAAAVGNDHVVENTGRITANAGQVLLTAKTTDISRVIVNNVGIIQANTIDDTGGVVRLVGGLDAGVVSTGPVTGTNYIDAKGGSGLVEISGRTINVKEAGISVDDEGSKNRGTISLRTGTSLTIDKDGTEGVKRHDLERFLATGNVKVRAGASTVGSSDSLSLTESMTWATGNNLSLVADKHVSTTENVQLSTGAGSVLTFRAGVVDNTGDVLFGTNNSIVNNDNGTVNIYGNQASNAGDLSKFYNPINRAKIDITGADVKTNEYQLVNNLEGLRTLPPFKDAENHTGLFALNTDISGLQGDGTKANFEALRRFAGTLDGYDGYSEAGSRRTISNFNLTKNAVENNVGLFTELVNQAVVRNLNLSGLTTANNGERTGGLAGIMTGQARVENVSITNSVITGETNVGGLVGLMAQQTTMNRAMSDATVNGGRNVGGLVGSMVEADKGLLLISESYFGRAGVVTATNQNETAAGGIVGWNEGRIEASYNEGRVRGREGFDNSTSTATGHWLGGIVGLNKGTIRNAYNVGHVDSADVAGGIAGYNAGGIVQRVYNAGYVNTIKGTVGAIVANNEGGTVEDAVVNRRATGNANFQGNGAGNWTNLAEINTTANSTTALNGISYSKFEGVEAGTTGPWRIIEGVSQPYFAWRYPNAPVVVSGVVSLRSDTGDDKGNAINRQLRELQVQSGDMAAGGDLGIVRTQADGSFYMLLDSTAGSNTSSGNGAIGGKDANAAMTVRLTGTHSTDKGDDLGALLGMTASMGSDIENAAHTGQTDGTTTRAQFNGMNVIQDTVTLSGSNAISLGNVLAALPQAALDAGKRTDNTFAFSIANDVNTFRNNLTLDARQSMRTEIGNVHLADGDITVQGGGFKHYGTAHLQNDQATSWSVMGGDLVLGASQDAAETVKNKDTAWSGTGGIQGNGNSLGLTVTSGTGADGKTVEGGNILQSETDAGIRGIDMLSVGADKNITLNSQRDTGIDNAGNAFDRLQLDSASGNTASVRTTQGFSVAGSGIQAAGADVTINFETSTAGMTQAAGVKANSLTISGGGDVFLTDLGALGNDVKTLSISNSSTIDFRQEGALTFNASSGGSSLTVQSRAGTLTTDGLVTATGDAASINLFGATGLTLGGKVVANTGATEVVLATNGNFINNVASTVADPTVSVGSGRWTVYANDVTTSTPNGMTQHNANATRPRYYGTAYNVDSANASQRPTGATGNVLVFANRPTLDANAVDGSKIYNGQAGADGANAVRSAANWVNQDGVTDTAAQFGFTQNAATRAAGNNVGTYAITAADFAVNSEYIKGTNTAATFTINRADLEVTASQQNRTYNATTAVANAAGFTTTGLVSGESLASVALSYDTRHAGAGTKIITASTAVAGSGTDLANYNVSYVNNTNSTNSTINRAAISAVGGITATDRVYNGTVTATANLSGATLTGNLDGANLGLSSTGATFGDKNASANPKNVTVAGLALTGSEASNYTLTPTTATTTATISRATISAVSGITAADRTYNGTNVATANLSAATLTGNLDGANLTLSSTGATFGDKNASANPKNVTVAGLALTGSEATNYQLTPTSATTTASIGRAALTVTAATDTKIFDGTTTSAAAPVVTGLQAGDTVTGRTQVFNDAAILGPNLSTLRVTNYVVNDGNAGANYNVTTATASGTISLAPPPVVVPSNNVAMQGTMTALSKLAQEAGKEEKSASGPGVNYANTQIPLTVIEGTGVSIELKPATELTQQISGNGTQVTTLQ